MFERHYVKTIVDRISEANNPLMQVVVGPRQTGKSTMLGQALAKIDTEQFFISADDAIVPSEEWLQVEWQQARNATRSGSHPVVLVVDEIQKVPHWSLVVKSLYDADRRNDMPVRVVLSGSSSLLLHKGLEDSLMGRFELIHSPHWSYSVSRLTITFITAATLAQRDLRATMLAGFRIFVKRLLSQRFRKTFWPLKIFASRRS